jgi:hypothetical protein
MIRYLTLTAFISFITFVSNSQTGVAINTNGAAPSQSAMLDVTSVNKGVLIPRMSSAQRKIIQNPQPGLLVFDLDKATIYFYDGAQWRPMTFTTEAKLPLIERVSTEPTDNIVRLGEDVGMFGLYAVAGAPQEKVNANWNQGGYMYILRKAISGKCSRSFLQVMERTALALAKASLFTTI